VAAEPCALSDTHGRLDRGDFYCLDHKEAFRARLVQSNPAWLKGLTRERLAKQAGITDTYVGKIENGRHNLTWTALTRLCRGLGVSRSVLAARVKENEPAEREWVP
jgi:DNA-binding XRE family transcriptional regulator